MQGLLETIQKWHIHPAVDHFTVAILIVAVLADLFATMFSTRLWLRYAALALMIVGTAAAWGSNVTGGWEADRVWKAVQAAGGPAYDTLHRHAQLGDWLPWVFLVLAVWRVGIQLFGFMAGMRGLYLLFAILAAIAISYQALPRRRTGLRLWNRHRLVQRRAVIAESAARGHGPCHADPDGLRADRDRDAGSRHAHSRRQRERSRVGDAYCCRRRARDARCRAESRCAAERLTDPCVIHERPTSIGERRPAL